MYADAVTPTFVFKALHGEALPLINGGRGMDAVSFLFPIWSKACVGWRRTVGEAYNLASGHETRIKESAAAINSVVPATRAAGS